MCGRRTYLSTLSAHSCWRPWMSSLVCAASFVKYSCGSCEMSSWSTWLRTYLLFFPAHLALPRCYCCYQHSRQTCWISSNYSILNGAGWVSTPRTKPAYHNTLFSAAALCFHTLCIMKGPCYTYTSSRLKMRVPLGFFWKLDVEILW